MKELITRFLAQKPKFFKAVQVIGVILTFVCGLPEFLAQFGFELPDAMLSIANKYIALGGAIAAMIAQFTVSTPDATNKVLDKINNGTKASNASKGA